MKIRDMELLVRVGETGSMTLAARQLHLTPAAVSAAVQRVEQDIGVRLFERTTRSLHPTEEGSKIIAGCVDVVNRWQRVLDEVHGHGSELAGSVVLSAPADTTYQILQSLVVTVCAEYPKLRVLLDTSDTIKHLHGDAIDMAIRYGPLEDSTLSARKLAVCPGIFVASADYLDKWGTPDSPQALEQHRCLTLQLSNAPQVSWQLIGRGQVHVVKPKSALCGNGYITRRWAAAGMGIAYKSLFDVIDDLEAGRLVRVLPDYIGDQVAIHMLFPSRRFQPTRVRVLDAAVTTHFAARAARCHSWLQQA